MCRLGDTGLIQGIDGAFYGKTGDGGAAGQGVVFPCVEAPLHE